jgi:hypothetical protein
VGASRGDEIALIELARQEATSRFSAIPGSAGAR